MVKKVKELLVIVLLATALVACTAVQAAPKGETQVVSAPVPVQGSRTITVVGAGKVNLEPDIARINVGAEARASTVAEAKTAVDNQVIAIVAALKEQGVADRDIQTSHYSIYYERMPVPAMVGKETRTEESQSAYRVSNMLQVTVRDVEKAGTVLDAVVNAGANQVYGVTFTVSDAQEWENAAREEAMADAKACALELARLSDVELTEVLSVSEVIGSSPVSVARMALESGMGGGGITPGELELSTQVQVTFAIQ